MMESPQGFCAQRFPLRARRNRGLGNGHWLTARFPRGPPEGHHLSAWPYLGPPAMGGGPPGGSEGGGSGPTRPVVPVDERRRVLDRDLLLRLHCVETPSDLCTVDVTDQHLHQVSESDLAVFDSVAFVKAGGNCLPLGPWAALPSLQELELPLNSLRGVRLAPHRFPHLQVLDVSYNALDQRDVLALAALPVLRVLHLSGNGLEALPADLGLCTETGARFVALEELFLDGNRLSEPQAFAALASLARLRRLDLSGNGVTRIPHLKPVEPGDEVPGDEVPGDEETGEEVPGEEPASLDGGERRGWWGEAVEEGEPGGGESGDPHRPHHRPYHRPSAAAAAAVPFPQLTSLDLSDNRICAYEHLLGLLLFPSLRNVRLCGNAVRPPQPAPCRAGRAGGAGGGGDAGALKQLRLTWSADIGDAPRHRRLTAPRRSHRLVTSHVPKVPRMPLELRMRALSLSQDALQPPGVPSCLAAGEDREPRAPGPPATPGGAAAETAGHGGAAETVGHGGAAAETAGHGGSSEGVFLTQSPQVEGDSCHWGCP